MTSWIILLLLRNIQSFTNTSWTLTDNTTPWLLIKQILRLKWIILIMISMILCRFFCIQFAENESVLLGARNALPCLADIWILRQVISKHKMSRSTLVKVMFICQEVSIKSKSGLQKMQKRNFASFRPYFIHIEWKRHIHWQIKKYVPGKRTKGNFALDKRLPPICCTLIY